MEKNLEVMNTKRKRVVLSSRYFLGVLNTKRRTVALSCRNNFGSTVY